MSIPPDLRSLGIPPASIPPSCGAALSPPLPPPDPPVSLLLLALFPSGGGASPLGRFGIPGTGGAPPIEAFEGPLETLPTIGAERSLITVTFFSCVPLVISPSSAPYTGVVLAVFSAWSKFICGVYQCRKSPCDVITYSAFTGRRFCCRSARPWRPSRRRRRWWWSSAESRRRRRRRRRRRWCGHCMTRLDSLQYVGEAVELERRRMRVGVALLTASSSSGEGCRNR